MSYVLSHDVFAAKGDPWDARARREQVPTGVRVREITGPSWRDVEISWRNEGFEPDGEPVKVSQRWTVPSPERQAQDRNRLLCEMRNENAPLYRAPEYRRVVQDEIKGRHPEAKDVVLTAEMLEKRKRQQAAVKARMTRAANRIKRQREEVMNILLSI